MKMSRAECVLLRMCAFFMPLTAVGVVDLLALRQRVCVFVFLLTYVDITTSLYRSHHNQMSSVLACFSVCAWACLTGALFSDG